MKHGLLSHFYYLALSCLTLSSRYCCFVRTLLECAASMCPCQHVHIWAS